MAETPSELKNKLDKSVLRSQYKQIRSSIPSEIRHSASRIISQRLLQNPLILQAKIISIYISFQSEVDTRSLINSLLDQQKIIVCPLISNHNISLRQVQALSQCSPDKMGILQPDPTSPSINPAEVEVFIVPGLAFDAAGYRLGFGKGYYDSLLSTTPGHKMGIAFTDQLCHHLPHQPHDIPMDQVVTESICLQPFLFLKK